METTYRVNDEIYVTVIFGNYVPCSLISVIVFHFGTHNVFLPGSGLLGHSLGVPGGGRTFS